MFLKLQNLLAITVIGSILKVSSFVYFLNRFFWLRFVFLWVFDDNFSFPVFRTRSIVMTNKKVKPEEDPKKSTAVNGVEELNSVNVKKESTAVNVQRINCC